MLLIKRLLGIFSLAVFLFSLAGCESKKISVINEKKELKNPPTLKVLYKDKSIDAVRGTYSWTIDNKDGTKKTTNACFSGAIELVENSTPLTVSPKSTITLNFTDKPENITVNIWRENKLIKQVETDRKVITPELKGSVIYEVIATWEQGTVWYAFIVNVN